MWNQYHETQSINHVNFVSRYSCFADYAASLKSINHGTVYKLPCLDIVISRIMPPPIKSKRYTHVWLLGVKTSISSFYPLSMCSGYVVQLGLAIRTVPSICSTEFPIFQNWPLKLKFDSINSLWNLYETGGDVPADRALIITWWAHATSTARKADIAWIISTMNRTTSYFFNISPFT